VEIGSNHPKSARTAKSPPATPAPIPALLNPAPPVLAVVAVELVFEEVVVAVVATVRFDVALDCVAVAVELLDKQLTALGTVTPLSPQSCCAYPVAMT